MKHRRLWRLLAAGMLLAAMTLSGCGGQSDPQEKDYKTKEDAIAAATKEGQEVLTEIEARDGKVVVVWTNVSEDASVPFSLGLIEKSDEVWKITSTNGVTMTERFAGSGMYPAKDGLISYAVSATEDDPIRDSYAEHKSANDWTFHWTIVPELPV
ncbi:MAG: hypothetical protein Q4A63_00245 [Butyricicoccus pullicaecorum]|nr:hypothetical protein [Butyricicoccus pullicaecorum]MDO4668222.1 hypothetical protein [Butyricicoccus pullicaecorum]